MNAHYKVLILGAGSGGISVASRLNSHIGSGQMALVEPAEFHYYQPLWTLVGGGAAKKESTQRTMQSVIPRGVKWIRDSVKRVVPEQKQVELTSGALVTYDFLVIATGLVVDFAQVKGAEANLGRNGVCSIYRYQDAEITAQTIEKFRGGTAIFTMPPVPIKCAGAPQKIMYLADEIFRRNGVREKTKLIFATAGKAIFGVPEFAKPLMMVAERKGIQVLFAHKLTEVRSEVRQAVFATEQGEVTMNYDLLHVVPPMRAHSYVADSGLAFADGAQKGWLKVHNNTLQHIDYPQIFGIGDVTGVPNSKTGAAIRKQAPVVVEQLLASMRGAKGIAQYDGYSSCPLITGFGKVILAEFGYDGKLMPTFPMDMTKERRSMWILKKDLLPPMYWHGMLKGRM